MSVAESPIKVQLRVVEAASRDVSRGIVRVDPTDIAALGARNGDLVLVTGKKTALGKLLPAQKDDRGFARAQLDGLLRESAGCGLNDFVQLQRIDATEAEQVTLRPRKIRPIERDLDYIATLIDGLPVLSGMCIRATLIGKRIDRLRCPQNTTRRPEHHWPEHQVDH